jgi:ABC-type transport system substrate-binding protein
MAHSAKASQHSVVKAVAGIAVAILIAATWIWKGPPVKEPLSLLKVHVGIQEALPDPAKIEVAGDWYFLGHISSGLVGFDHIAGKFKPLLAESWQAFSSGAHTFTLREDAKFQDGTPITSDDVIASLKRLLIKRTSTHFPLWEYVDNGG